MLLEKIVIGKFGARPGFHEGHVIKSLLALSSEEAIGRKKLSKILGIGETSARSLIKRLYEMGLVKVDKIAGAILTDKGNNVVKVFDELLKVIPLNRDILGFNWDNTVLIVIKDLPPKSTTVTIIRDKAISVNAGAALILLYSNNKLVAPGVNVKDLHDKIVDVLQTYVSKYCSKECTLIYASIRTGEPLEIAGLKLGYEIIRHFCIRREYCD